MMRLSHISFPLAIAIALLTLLPGLFSGNAHAQQDPKFNQYMFNPLGINPAYAGSRDALSAVALFRNQWVGFKGAPITQTFSIHGPLASRKMGLGFQITNDIIGPRNTINAEVDYAYRFPLLEGKLALGLGGGIYYHTFNWDKIDYIDQGDFVPTYGERQAWSPDVDFGTYWNNNRMYFGFELAHLTNPRVNILNNDSVSNTLNGGGNSGYRQFRHVSITAGRAFVLNKSLVLKPSVLYKQAGLYRGMFDLNVSILVNNKLWMGITARTDYGAVLIFEYIFNKKIRMGYSFDYPINKLNLQTRGTSHELFLGYDFGVSRAASISPRYF
ncbi:MAG: type IX secretion system membrane protein PorP/SprF [Salibacteraceae bacterium]